MYLYRYWNPQATKLWLFLPIASEGDRWRHRRCSYSATERCRPSSQQNSNGHLGSSYSNRARSRARSRCAGRSCSLPIHETTECSLWRMREQLRKLTNMMISTYDEVALSRFDLSNTIARRGSPCRFSCRILLRNLVGPCVPVHWPMTSIGQSTSFIGQRTIIGQ